MVRTVLLPKELENRLDTLTTVEEEAKGVLLFRPNEEICPIEYLFLLNIDSEGKVSSDGVKLSILNKFLNINTDYRYVEFHTHTIGTIKKFGDYYAYNLSKTDCENMASSVKGNVEYMHLLVTPKKKILSGLDDPILRIGEFPEYEEKYEAVDTALKTITEDAGATNLNLSARIA